MSTLKDTSKKSTPILNLCSSERVIISDNYWLYKDVGVWSVRNKKILKATVGSHGYPSVDIGKGYSTLVHRLMAKYFIPNPLNKREVNHKNGVRTDFTVSNLEWCTPSENMQHCYSSGHRVNKKGYHINVGGKHGMSLLTESDVRIIKRMISEKELFVREIGALFGVSRQAISDIKNNRNWKHIKI